MNDKPTPVLTNTMTGEAETFERLIEQARCWPRDSCGEGKWFNEMADWMERVQQIACDTSMAHEDRIEQIRMLGQSQSEPNGELPNGTRVSLVGPLAFGVPADGWKIIESTDKRARTYCVQHSNGSVCYVPHNLVSRAETVHASDCATNNAPALPAGACDCGALKSGAEPHPNGRCKCIYCHEGFVTWGDCNVHERSCSKNPTHAQRT